MTAPDTTSATADRSRRDASAEVHRHRWSPPPDAPARPCGVYLMHGIGEHAARYERLARRLASEGWPVGAHDHPGHGRSGGRRGRLPAAGSYASCALAECERFARETGAAPFVFGHSLGGVVACELVLEHGFDTSGLVLSAPAIVPRLTPGQAAKLRTLSLLAPRLVLEFPYDPTDLTHDPEQRRAALADEWIHGFKSAEQVGWLMRAAARALADAAELDVDVLVLVAGRDALIDVDRTREFAARLPEGRATVRVYGESHHELLNEGPTLRGRVEDDIVGWLDARTRDAGST